MKGCSKKTRKNYLGGAADINLAYPSNNIKTTPNPFLAYTGKGGACSSSLTPSLAVPLNTNGGDKTLPNTGPDNVGQIGTPFLNPVGNQHGGSCGCGMPLMSGGGCGTCGLMKGGRRRKKGGCGPLCAVGFMVGGNHRIGCKCSSCKKLGGTQFGGNPGIPYPDGLVGAPWTPSTGGWPGVDGVQGGRNFLPPNQYKTDAQTSMISTGAQPPYSVGGKRSKKQKGGTLSNFLGQDLINLGRQFQFGLGSTYNALAGYAAPVNPMPWKGQLPNTPSLSTMTSMASV
jgi:hypothetical protein